MFAVAHGPDPAHCFPVVERGSTRNDRFMADSDALDEMRERHSANSRHPSRFSSFFA
ncbi:hypothetical protein J2W25_004622 [Variovorax boronicumulans]|uniref:Uncharacterized protein n=1 Tax=Variovorax boronicumulans TaxID=436515 RepID=A0AAW8E1R3_9BURK|nr:hypothetical protein [Variovorax boronicumulans]MDP9880294.1 hypothetical protein [Variovorax boronicumulans]MDP9925579.1 hypothetical protein [Variovorax boronicumulans]